MSEQFEETLAWLLFLHAEGEIDEEEFIMLTAALHEEFEADGFVDLGERLDINNLPFSAKEMFRFTENEIHQLCEHLRIPEKWVTKSRYAAPGWEVLCMLLRRFAYPCRLKDLQLMFGRQKSHISEFINELVHFLHEKWESKLFWAVEHLDEIEYWCECVTLKGSPLDKCYGFIDGTVRPICRPTDDQRTVYNGHKRVHAIKFQSIMSPCGLIISLYGPVEGRRHDITLYRFSNIEDKLKAVHEDCGAYIYGDPAYMLRPWLITPYKGNVHADQQAFNKDMSSVRQSVEWGFGKVVSLFAFLDFKKNLKLFLSPIGKYYPVGVLLANCHTCLNGSLVSSYFECIPPTLEEYLA
jgi:hypothetical protein